MPDVHHPDVQHPEAVSLGEPFGEEHEALRQTVRRYVTEQLDPHHADWDRDGNIPDAVVTGLAELGLFGLSVPEADGGQGADQWSELVLWQELGRCLSASATEVLAAHALDGIGMLAAHGPDRDELAGAIAGSHLVAVAIDDVNQVTATSVKGEWRLTGFAPHVVAGMRAHTLLVVADTRDGAKVFAVPMDTDGVERSAVDTTSLRGADVAHVSLEDVRLDRGAVLTWLAQALATRREYAWLRAAIHVAQARVTTEEAFAYANQRTAFGKRLDQFQVQQHRLVELATAVEATHRLVQDVADKAVRGKAQAHEVARLDLAARHLVFDVAEESLQLHGGYGYSQEYRVQQAWRDASFARAAEGGDDARRDRLATLVIDLPTTPSPRVHDPLSRLPLYSPDALAAQAQARTRFQRIATNVDEWEAEEHFPRGLFGELGEAGILGMLTPPELGGSGPDPLKRMAVIEVSHELRSGGLAADIGAHADLALVYVNTNGTDEQRKQYVASGVAGESIGSLGITEPAAGSNVAGITTTATRTDGGWVLNGTKHFITDGAWADWMVVTAKTADLDDKPHRGISLFVVDLDRPGVTRKRMKMLGWRTSHTGEVHLEDVHVPDEALLGEENTGFYQIMVNFAWERLSMSWAAVSTAEALLRQAIAMSWGQYAGDRSLREHDAWRHRVAELAARIEVGRAITEHALRLYVGGGDPQEQNRVTAMAKLVTQRLCFDVADEVMATAGMDGQRRSTGWERHWRDARLGPIGGGTDEIMREILKKTYGMT